MAIVLPITGAIQWLEFTRIYIIDPLDWTGRLYVNDYTPVLSSVAGDFTAAADMNTIQLSDYYSAATTDPGVGAKMDASDILFTQTADTSQTAYGWFVLDTGGTLIFAERFASPIPLEFTDDKVKITNHVLKMHQ